MADRVLTLRGDRSWFSKASTDRHGLLSSSQHELPRWRSPSPMTASLIPPPIVQSTYGSSSPRTPPAALASRSYLPQSVTIPRRPPQPTPLQDRQNELHADLQFLLDAQASALIQGLEGNDQHDERSSTGSTTPTAQSMRRTPHARRRPSARRTIGLRSARKGIYKSIVALSAVKEDELNALDDEAQEKERTLARIEEWEQKRRGLQEASNATGQDDENVRAQRLRREANVLQQEIDQAELQLMDMKVRQRKLLRQAGAAENAVQATLASYKSALSMLEADVQKFLSLRPNSNVDVRPLSQEVTASMWELPAQRRTLEMARSEFNDEREAVKQRRQVVEREKTALVEGAKIWKTVTAQVTDFEKRLRKEMALLGNSTSNHSGSAWDDEDDTASANTQQEASERLKELLSGLDIVLGDLEAQFRLSEERDWKLMIAAIGAELDTLKKGKAILQGVLGITESEAASGEVAADGLVDTNVAGVSPDGNGGDDSGNEINALDEKFKGESRRKERDESSDDDPDPELLFSTLGS
ncbi:Hypothetical protein R9X50_00027700 [Acrodontium crateriforme]|uniref:Uncharacterized protein n=1 Tax=Acrodontium crateriforme TaxID=150365 RepID=A0AAQ3R1X6_9PEZI|nr:Hypothetical protein R9X50_00027700 [Acrodontium crateriforme]